ACSVRRVLMLALDPVFDTQATFRVLLQALARPGRVLDLPVPAADAPWHAWVVATLLTLLDSETPFAVVGVDSHLEVERFVRHRTVSPLAAVEAADFVATDAAVLDAGLAQRLNAGTLEFPDTGSTLLVTLDSLGERGTAYTLHGPGVSPPVTVAVDRI